MFVLCIQYVCCHLVHLPYQVFNVNVEVMFQMLFTDSEFMREFLKSRNVSSEPILFWLFLRDLAVLR